MVNLPNYQLDHLQDLLGGNAFDFRGIYLSNVKIRGNVRLISNGDVVLDSGRGIKWDKVGIAFGLFGSTPTVSFYTNNTLRAYVDNTGIVLPSAHSYYVTSGYGMAALSTGIAVTLGIIATRESVGFYTNSTLRGNIDSVGLGLTGSLNFYVKSGSSLATSDAGILTTLGTFNSKEGIGFYTGLTLRSFINVDGITLLTAGAGLVFASGGTTGYYGTSTSLDLYISGTERAAIANNSGSSVNSPLYLDLGGTLSQVKYDNSDLGSGTKHYLYIT